MKRRALTIAGIAAALASAAVAAIAISLSGGAQPAGEGDLLARLGQLQRDIREALAITPGAQPPTGLQVFQAGVATEGDDSETAPAWRPLAPGESPGGSIVLLVHGLDEPGSIWDTLAPRLAAAGHAVVRFEYPNDQRISDSTDAFAAALRELRGRGVQRLAIVAHSMGGLVARDALTRDDLYAGAAEAPDLPAVERLITLGTPNRGSPWARLRALAEIREQVARFADKPDPARALAFLRDGVGEAGEDLMPGSAYLADLNSRPLPQVPITVIIGRLAPGAGAGAGAQLQRWLGPGGLVAQLLGAEDVARLREAIQIATESVGDGVVPVESAMLAGAEDIVFVEANHRGMIHTVEFEQQARSAVGLPRIEEPPAVPIVLERLGGGSE